jgi:hypothetical protein
LNAMNKQESRAKELFDQIAGHPNPAALFRTWVEAKQQEADFLEFKCAGKIESQIKQIKKYWSQAISGFANTEGGVLIWGIATDRIASSEESSREIDAASGFDPAQSPEAMMQLLKDVKLDVVAPPVLGIDYLCCDAGNGDGTGFVVCFVPEGASKPYRATLDEHKQYYQRIGDSFTIISHSMLASLFYPRTTPCFEIDAILDQIEDTSDTSVHPPDKKSNYYFRMLVGNVGTASARDTVVVVKSNYAGRLNGKDPLFQSPYDNIDRQRVQVSASRPIHPLEDKTPCISGVIKAPTHLNFQGHQAGSNMDPTRIIFTVDVCALDTKPVRGAVAFDINDAAKYSTSREGVRKPVVWES